MVRRVYLASIAHENRPLLHRMALGTVGRTHIDAVLVVEAPADRVAFDHEVAHDDRQFNAVEETERREEKLLGVVIWFARCCQRYGDIYPTMEGQQEQSTEAEQSSGGTTETMEMMDIKQKGNKRKPGQTARKGNLKREQ